MKLLNKSINVGDVVNGRTILNKSITVTDTIRLSYKDDIAIVDTLSANLRLLEKAFNKITISHTSGKVETDNETKSTKIGGETTININIDNVLEIKSIISDIRNYIIGNS